MILSLLIRFGGPATGYKLASIVNDIIGPFAKISNGRLYPLLAKLEEQRYIESDEKTDKVPTNERHARAYLITKTGRKRFHDLMMDTSSSPGEYQRLFQIKAAVLPLLTPAERQFLLDHYQNYCQAHVLHLITERDDLAAHAPEHKVWTPVTLDATLDSMRHLEDQWRLELTWIQRLRENQHIAQQTIGSEQGQELLNEDGYSAQR
jgi:DNA-binding PadR family transcriptional regulator